MINVVLDVIVDALLDSLRVLPFLFFTYLLIEFIEHKASEKLVDSFSRYEKLGPLLGAVTGVFPHFSIAAANLYTARLISIGALLSVFLSTSEDALAILLSSGAYGTLALLILVKLIIAIPVGFAADLLVREPIGHTEQELAHKNLHAGCGHDECEHGVLRPALKHSLKSFFFVLISLCAVNAVVELVGSEQIGSILNYGWWFQPLFAALIGLIPSCASSIILTEFYLGGVMSFGSFLAGLLSTTGISYVVLIRSSSIRQKKPYILMGVLFAISLVCGYAVHIFWR